MLFDLLQKKSRRKTPPRLSFRNDGQQGCVVAVGAYDGTTEGETQSLSAHGVVSIYLTVGFFGFGDRWQS
jgi:hypothetical protein